MRIAFALMALITLAIPAPAQQLRDNRDKQLSCDSNDNYGGRRSRLCDVRELTLGPSSRLEIEPGRNGGVTVRGWSQNSILVRARVEAWADSDSEARSVASQVRVEAAGGRIRGTGPDLNGLFNWNEDRNWAVSFEVFTPFNTDLTIDSHNGGITISDVRGQIDVETHNGGLRMTRVAGDIRGQSHNGGIQADIDGNTSDIRQIDLSTHNGAITLSVPSSFGARVETQTHHGRLESDFPITVRGRLDGGDMNFNIGAGGPLVRLGTHNGGIRLRRM